MNNEGYQITYTGEEVQELLDKAGTAVQTETDPTVPSWAKAEEKPTYTATEVGALPDDTELFSGSYNDLTDKPTIPDSLSDLSDDSTHRLVTDAEKTEWNGKSDFSGSYDDLTDKPTIPAEQIQSDWNQSNTSAKDYIKNKPTIPVVPSNVSAFTNDAGYITSYTETDPVFSASAAHSITSADISMWNTRKAQSIPFGHVDGSSIATAFTATVEGITALEDGVCCYLNNTVITSAASTTTPKCWTLNINNLGAKPVYVTTAAATFSTTQFTLNYKFLFTYDSSLNNGEGGWYIGQLFNTNTTYSTITQAEIDAGTGTKARNITPKLLRDNFYTEDEVDGLLADKADSADLATVATSGSYNDLDDKPTIPTAVTESTVSGWGFTKNAGTITGVTMNGASKGTSGVVDLGTVITAHQDISGKADKSEMGVSTSGDQTTITLKSGTSATVINQHQSLSGYVQTSNTAGLIKNDGTIDTTSYGTYSKPAGGIPASDIASGVIPTVPSNIVTGSSQSYTIWSGTQAQYDAITTKDNNTIYLIKES